MPAPGDQRLADGPLVVAEDLPVGGVELLHELERPAPGDDVAAEQVGPDALGELLLAARRSSSSTSSSSRSALPISWWNEYRCPRARSSDSSASDILPAAATASSETPSGRRC